MLVMLIGGTNDKKLESISGVDTFISVPRRHAGFQSVVGDLGHERYVPQEIIDANGESRLFFVIEGGDVIDILLNAYRG
ncbi:hypothetical protein [Pseudomonas canadensis]|uniref:hypothetical protein n=1 Tax=Pseudomonas canadensis TaxID=915099 RepID=UPI003B9E4964